MAMPGINPPKGLDFSNARSTWGAWKQRFERYRTASGITDKRAEQQVDILIYVMGDEAESIHNQLTVRAQKMQADGSTPDASDTLYVRTLEAFDGYFNPQENTLHYRIMFGSKTQTGKETNEQFIRDTYELATKCRWEDEVKQDMIKTRLLAGMSDKSLARELQLKAGVTLEDIKLAMRSKEVILQNQKCEIDGAAVAVAELAIHQVSKSSREESPMSQKSLGQGSQRAEAEGKGSRRTVSRSSHSSAAKYNYVSDCKFCGLNHRKGQCPAYNKRCVLCDRFNHFAKVCKARVGNRVGNRAHAITVLENDDSSDDEQFSVNCITPVNKSSSVDSEWLVDVIVKGLPHQAKVDTGAQVNVMSVENLKSLGVDTVTRSKAALSGYSGYNIPVLGKVKLPIALGGSDSNGTTEIVAQFYIINQPAPTLLSLPTIRELGLLPSANISEISHSGKNVRHIVEQNADVFEGLGRYTKTVSLKLKAGAVPKALPTKHIPSGVRDKLRQELDSLENKGIICRDNEPAEWLSPIVIVNKPNGDIRICLNPQHLNSQLVRSHCMLPTTEEIFSRIAGSCCFSTLDARQGFHQVPLDEKSSKLVGFLTPYGKYRYLRLPMGISVAPELFHQIMIDALAEVPGVEVFIDDILVHGKSLSEHNNRLEEVLLRLKQVGITLNREKSVIGKQQVDFLGHKLTAGGIEPQRGKLEAIEDMVVPKNRKELESYLGFVAYLAKFVENLSELTVPLRQVCKKGVLFQWERPQIEAFENIKQAILNAPVLAYFDPEKSITLSADASAHSLGAVLLQEHRPVVFAAKSLSEAQQNYAQIEKELLAIVFACKRFKYYIWGRGPVSVETDHRSLLGLFQKDVGDISPRLASMRLDLIRYPVDMRLIFRPGKEMVLADTLSRSCPPETEVDDDELDPILQVCAVVIRSEEVMAKYQRATAADEELSVVVRYVKHGWPSKRKSCAGRALSYWSIKDSLSVVNGVVFYGARLVIPNILRDEVLGDLHTAHQGVSKTLQRAQSSVFWPGLRRRVEEKCLSCEQCRQFERSETREPLITIPIPSYPFQVVGADLFTQGGKDYLLVVDYLSKFPIVKCLQQSTVAAQVISCLSGVFSDFGTPEVLISDNGPQFRCHEFARFCKDWAVEHRTSSPLHPSGNGQAERWVGTVKSMIIKRSAEGKDWWKALLLLRNTPVDDNLLSPSQLLQGRVLRDSIPVEQRMYQVSGYNIESLRVQLGKRQSTQKYHHDRKCGKEKPPLAVGQDCYFKTAKGAWIPGKVQNVDSTRSYIIDTPSGNTFRRNRIDIRPSLVDNPQGGPQVPQVVQRIQRIEPEVPEGARGVEAREEASGSCGATVPSQAGLERVTRSGRRVKLPSRYADYEM